jgi:esterase/lipase
MDKWKMEFVKNDPEFPQINYVRNPVMGGYELEKLMRVVESHLPNVTDPTLIIQASNDPVVDPVSGQEIFDKLGAKEKHLARIVANHHGILRGREANEVNAMVLKFLNKLASDK